MPILSPDSFMGSLFPLSVCRGYTLPRSDIMGETLPSKGIISTKKNIPQEWLDEMMNTFQNGSIAEFYDKYLENVFSIQDHGQVLLEADEILRTDVQKLHLPEDPLLAVAGLDVAHNADEYGHHLFQTACFLKEQNQLPKECRVIFGRKINPALYEERELFKTIESCLVEPTKKIPKEWRQGAFYKWVNTDDSAAYLSQMKKMAALELILANNGLIPVNCAIENYIHTHHVPFRRNRPCSPRRSWRGRSE